MSEPTPVKVTRYRCPSCGRTYSGRSGAREHMGRCWYAPENRGCKTCRWFEHDYEGEGCGKDVDLSGHPTCPTCSGFGFENDPWESRQTCTACGNDPAKRDEVKAGPIVHCDLWQPSEEYEPDA